VNIRIGYNTLGVWLGRVDSIVLGRPRGKRRLGRTEDDIEADVGQLACESGKCSMADFVLSNIECFDYSSIVLISSSS
jgi:hypothetical protein